MIRGKCKLNLDAFVLMYDGTYDRTCEPIVLELEVFQIDKVPQLLRQGT